MTKLATAQRELSRMTKFLRRMTTLRPKRQWQEPVLLAVFLLATAGCRLFHTTTALPGKVAGTVTPGGKAPSPTIDPLELQLRLQRFADDFSSRTIQALDDYADLAGTESARTEALKIKLAAVSGLVSIASGPNPNANLLDLVGVAALTRLTVEDYWIKRPDGSAFQSWLEVSRRLETNAWDLAAQVLKPAEIAEIRRAIPDWYAQDPTSHNPFFTRPGQLAKLLVTTEKKGNTLQGLLDLVNLDPTSGLDPAVREVTRSRLFAERAMFTMQRMPFLLRFQTELLTRQLVSQPEVHLALTNTARLAESADRMSRAAESVSQTAAQLPDRIAAERKEILAALDQQEGKLRELAAEVNLALGSGEKMSTSLNTTLTTFDALMKRFGVGEPSRGPPTTQSTPFKIIDYAQTADRVAAMAQQLDLLLKDANGTLEAPALDKRIADLSALTGKARVDAQSILNHAFLLAAGLVLLTLACALLYRRLTRHHLPPGTGTL